MQATLIEADRRRPEFTGGTPIRMLDGQVWYFARPSIRIDMVATPAGIVPFPAFDFGPDGERIDPALGPALTECIGMFHRQEKGSADQFQVINRATIVCLIRNYDLTVDEIMSLVTPDLTSAEPLHLAAFLDAMTQVLWATISGPAEAWLRARAAVAGPSPSTN